MSDEIRFATKAQADAVRAYLATLGATISHVQALEVIARGEGMRSRHLLAKRSASRDADASTTPCKVKSTAGEPIMFTRFSYSYVDGSNCKRHSSTVFRGRLTVKQLSFIASKLDDRKYFVPAQVGLESLHMAFTDDGGDDHYWHCLDLADSEHWTVDAEGFVVAAGDVCQEAHPAAGAFATDADCENLVWRFARVVRWDEGLQKQALHQQAYRVTYHDVDEDQTAKARALASRWSRHLLGASQDVLQELLQMLLEEGFSPAKGPGAACELQRSLGPNAYQYVIVRLSETPAPQGTAPTLVVDFDVSTLSGEYLTWAPLLELDVSAPNWDGRLAGLLHDQVRATRALPELYDAKFE
jgi:hypothetical protein